MPSRVRFDLPKEGATEIRVHGVGGTGPDAILGDPYPEQVAGDERAGFFRPSQPDPILDHTVEAYSWGGLTSRKATRALWILLLPLTLTNLAGWMIVRSGPGRLFAYIQERLCRVIALFATVLMIVGVAMVTADLVSLQCGGSPACMDGRWWLRIFENDFFRRPLRRVVVGIVPPIVLLGFLVRRSLESRKEYEEFSPGRGAGRRATEAGEDADLSSPDFWHRPTLVRNLTALHLAGTLAVLAYLLSESIVEVHALADSMPWWLNWTRGGSLAALGVTVAWLMGLRWKRGPVQPNRLSRRFHWGYAAVVAILFLATATGAVLVHVPGSENRLPATFREAPLKVLLIAGVIAIAVAILQIVAWALQIRKELWDSRRGDRAQLVPPALRVALFCLLLAPVAAVIWSSRRMEIVYGVLAIQFFASIIFFRAWLPAAIAAVGLMMGPWAWKWSEAPQFHAGAVVAALVVLLILFDWSWPRIEFRWGGPSIIAMLGLLVLGAVISGASTRFVDYLDKRQSPAELGNDIVEVIERNYKAAFNEDVKDAVLTRVDELFAAGRPSLSQLGEELEDAGIPRGVVITLFEQEIGKRPSSNDVRDALDRGFRTLGFTNEELAAARVFVQDVYDLEMSDNDVEKAGLPGPVDDHSTATSEAEKIAGELGARGVPESVLDRVYLLSAQGDRRPIDIVLSDAYDWLAVGVSGSVLIAAFAMIALYLAQHGGEPVADAPPIGRNNEDDEERDPGAKDLSPDDREKVERRVIRMKKLKEIAGAGDLAVTYIVGLLVVAVIVSWRAFLSDYGVSTKAFLDDRHYWLRQWFNEPFPEGWEALLNPSAWFVAALPLVAVTLIRRSYSDQESRRKIGIVWDLATFWPRRFHPLAPPAYSERAVPELQQRLRQGTRPGKCIVLAAHSQGSIIGYASLLPLTKSRAARVSFATYGSPLGSYYRRFFPSYFDTPDFEKLEERLRANHSWKNFWRPTDPIAGCVFTIAEKASEGRDRRLFDPWGWWRVPGQPRPNLQVHSDYMDDPVLRKWITEAARCPEDESKASKVE